MESSDIEIRAALHSKLLKKHHLCPDTIIVDELGLAHGKNRVDIAVLNGCLHGYEIKSSKDNLSRLPSQLNQYQNSLQKLTIVTAPNHLEEVRELMPVWSGLVVAEKGRRGAIHFSTERRAKINPNVDVIAMAHLLWKKEAAEFLTRFGYTDKEINKTRKQLYEQIAHEANTSQLISWIKEKFMTRDTWRAGLRSM